MIIYYISVKVTLVSAFANLSALCVLLIKRLDVIQLVCIFMHLVFLTAAERQHAAGSYSTTRQVSYFWSFDCENVFDITLISLRLMLEQVGV